MCTSNMNLIPSNNLKEIILTEYELITDQISWKSDHYLDFLNKIELLLITVKYHIQKFTLTGFLGYYQTWSICK